MATSPLYDPGSAAFPSSAAAKRAGTGGTFDPRALDSGGGSGDALRDSRPLDSILGVLSSKFGVVRPVNNIDLVNDDGQPQGELIQLLTYLENPSLRVGVDVGRGGVVGHISSQAMPSQFAGRSLINSYDCGRMLQQSYYGCEDGSCWHKRPWRWNPGEGAALLVGCEMAKH